MSNTQIQSQVTGTDDDDEIETGAQADNIDAKDGDDTVVSGSGDDYVEGGAGDDRLIVGSEDNNAQGDDGASGLSELIDEFSAGSGSGSELIDEFFESVGGDAGNDSQGDSGASALSEQFGDPASGSGSVSEEIDEFFENVGADSEPDADSDKDRAHGEQGSDYIEGKDDNDLLVGDRAGAEWALVDGEWVYDETKLAESDGNDDTHDDVLVGGEGKDVLIGGLGDDTHLGGEGEDLVNAGEGRDMADGGEGDDTLHLEGGSDLGVGGLGADTIHAAGGDDTVYGDLGNLLDNGEYGSSGAGNGFSFLGQEGGWQEGETQIENNVQTRSISQNVDVGEGENYTVNLDLALSSLSAQGAASVEVYWNGDLVNTLRPGSSLYQNFEMNVTGAQGDNTLELREVIELGSVDDGQAVYTETTEISASGQDVSAEGFAPGQSNLYQIINSQLYVFDTETNEYSELGDGLGVTVNAAGFNADNNLIYGFATGSNGTDSLGNDIGRHDLIAIDANGASYRVGHVGLETEIGGNNVFVGDFGPDGALYAMRGGASEIYRIDVNATNPDGSIPYEVVPIAPGSISNGFADFAWVENEQAFIAVSGNGTIHKIDPINLVDGEATVTKSTVVSTTVGGEVIDGLPSGTYGAVFTDAEGNLYAGLNGGDHDGDGATGASGAIYQITGFDGPQAQATLLAASPTTNKNDGISDPRGISAFTQTDGDASVLISNVAIVGGTGGNDFITGGQGSDIIYGEGGGDTIHSNEGADRVSGGDGADTIYTGTGNDLVSGGAGDDTAFLGEGADTFDTGYGDADSDDGNDLVHGEGGNDTIYGGGGEDSLHGGADDDLVSGEAGNDELFGGAGNDTVSGGLGDDKAYLGEGDDTFENHWWDNPENNGSDEIYGEGGADTIKGGGGDDTVDGGSGEDVLYGQSGDDFVSGGTGDDALDGGTGGDKLVGGAGEDTIKGGEGDDHMWGGEWTGDDETDTFVFSPGSGQDMVHDFETGKDIIDLSAYGLTWEELQPAIQDHGWAVSIELGSVGGEDGDRIFLTNVTSDDISADNFDFGG